MRHGFDEAVASFREFLEKYGWSTQLLWVRPGDVLLDLHRRMLIKVPVPAENEDLARSTFDRGLETQLGVLFAALCQVPGGTCCYVWTPENPDEAERGLMPTGLKLSVREGENLEGKQIKNGLYWRWMKWRYRKHQQHKALLFQ